MVIYGQIDHLFHLNVKIGVNNAQKLRVKTRVFQLVK